MLIVSCDTYKHSDVKDVAVSGRKDKVSGNDKLSSAAQLSRWRTCSTSMEKNMVFLPERDESHQRSDVSIRDARDSRTTCHSSSLRELAGNHGIKREDKNEDEQD